MKSAVIPAPSPRNEEGAKIQEFLKEIVSAKRLCLTIPGREAEDYYSYLGFAHELQDVLFWAAEDMKTAPLPESISFSSTSSGLVLFKDVHTGKYALQHPYYWRYMRACWTSLMLSYSNTYLYWLNGKNFCQIMRRESDVEEENVDESAVQGENSSGLNQLSSSKGNGFLKEKKKRAKVPANPLLDPACILCNYPSSGFCFPCGRSAYYCQDCFVGVHQTLAVEGHKLRKYAGRAVCGSRACCEKRRVATKESESTRIALGKVQNAPDKRDSEVKKDLSTREENVSSQTEQLLPKLTDERVLGCELQVTSLVPPATCFCLSCEQFYCSTCFTLLHARGNRMHHVPVSAALVVELGDIHDLVQHQAMLLNRDQRLSSVQDLHKVKFSNQVSLTFRPIRVHNCAKRIQRWYHERFIANMQVKEAEAITAKFAGRNARGKAASGDPRHDAKPKSAETRGAGDTPDESDGITKPAQMIAALSSEPNAAPSVKSPKKPPMKREKESRLEHLELPEDQTDRAKDSLEMADNSAQEMADNSGTGTETLGQPDVDESNSTGQDVSQPGILAKQSSVQQKSDLPSAGGDISKGPNEPSETRKSSAACCSVQ